MLTYPLSRAADALPLYEQLYRRVRDDILAGRLTVGEKLPSKRSLARYLKVSVVTVEGAYGQLVAEGYLRSEEKRGYYVCPVDTGAMPAKKPSVAAQEQLREYAVDFATNHIETGDFPFSVWARLMRRTLLDAATALLHPLPHNGAPELRQAIAKYLYRSRGIWVEAEQIVVGAGTEYLYNLILQLLGRECVYAVEDPGYHKAARVCELAGISCQYIGQDAQGIRMEELRGSGATAVHISPAHHYPTGAVMPIARRQELLRWAGEREERYIIEDDYDSEFRFAGKPIPTLQSVDESGRVLYLNTFSKTIAPSIRVAYLVLPSSLTERYREKLGFYSCTVPALEQYTLAKFLSEGYFERHIARMKTQYRAKRDCVIAAIGSSSLSEKSEIAERDAGLHFLLRLQTRRSDGQLRDAAERVGMRLAFLSEYCQVATRAEEHVLVVNYSGVDRACLPAAMERLASLL